MTDHPESGAAWRELLDAVRDLDRSFLEGPRAVGDDRTFADGYRTLATLLGVAWDTYLFAEPTRPIFTEVNTPFRRDRRWGGDNTDAWYHLAPIDPTRRYRVSGHPHDSVYFSLTVYNEPAPGAWSDRIVGIVRDSDLTLDADGGFSFELGPTRPEGYDGVFLELTPDAAVAFTRDYQVDPLHGQPVSWIIEPLDEPDPVRHGDAETATALRSAARWLQTMFAIVPLAVGVRPESAHTSGHEISQLANDVGAPYRVPDANFGWSAADACYAFGSYDLAEDEALVITHRPPDCRFWNVVTWNQFMATHNATDGRTSLNHGSAVADPDGSVTVVVSREPVDHPNSITTMGYPRGNLAFRWFLADEVPEQPVVRVMKTSEL